MSTVAQHASGEDIGARVMALWLTLSIIAFFVTLIRSINRIQDRHYGADDICAGFAALFTLIIAATNSWSAVRGCYNPANDLSLAQVELCTKTNTLNQFYISIAAAMGKISIALLQIRILGVTFLWKRVLLWLIIAITIVFTIFTSCMTFFQCRDPKAAWDLPLRAHTTCLNASTISVQATVTGAWYTAADFLLALFPILLVWELHLPLRKKLGILLLLGLGIITGIFSALKTSLLPTLAKTQGNDNSQFLLQTYAALEVFLLIVLGCVPTMKRPWEKLMDNQPVKSVISGVRRVLTRQSRRSSSGVGSDNDSDGNTVHRTESITLHGEKTVGMADVEACHG